MMCFHVIVGKRKLYTQVCEGQKLLRKARWGKDNQQP